jgi:hypothetical protein
MVCSPFMCVSLFSSHLRVGRLARGSILASIIRIMGCGPLRVWALYASGFFVVFYVVTVAQFLWVCEVYEPHPTGFVPFFRLPFVPCLCCYESCSRRIPTCPYRAQVAILQMTSESHPCSFSSIYRAQPYIQRQ